MNVNVIIGIVVGILCFFIPISLIQFALKRDKEKKLEQIRLKVNWLETVFSLIVYLLSFAMSCFGLITFIFFPPESFPSISLLIIIPLCVLLSVSFIIQLSHLVYEGRRKIVWDKALNLLKITEKHKEFELDLKSDDLKIVEFIPILTYRFPGNDFPVLVVYDNKNHVKISGMIYTNYDFYVELTRNKNYSTIKQQFNILF